MRDLVELVEARLSLPFLSEGRIGDESRDCVGEAVNEVEVEVHLDVCESMCALEVADVSLSAEFRLERLASMATGLFAMLLEWVGSFAWERIGVGASNGTTSTGSCHKKPPEIGLAWKDDSSALIEADHRDVAAAGSHATGWRRGRTECRAIKESVGCVNGPYWTSSPPTALTLGQVRPVQFRAMNMPG